VTLLSTLAELQIEFPTDEPCELPDASALDSSACETVVSAFEAAANKKLHARLRLILEEQAAKVWRERAEEGGRRREGQIDQ